jgi:hypothetical protein
MTRYLTASLVAALLLLLPVRARAGAWTQEPGHFYLTASYTYFFATQAVDDGGASHNLQIPENLGGLLAQADARYTDSTLALYGEVGLWPRHLNLVFYVPVYKWVGLTAIDDSGSFGDSGVGDATVALKYKFYDCKFVVSGQVELGIPSGNALKTHIPTGDNEWSYEGRLMMAKDFYPVPLFLDVEVGFRKRNSGEVMDHGFTTNIHTIKYSDDIPFLVMLGLKLQSQRLWKQALLIMATANGILSTRDGDATMTDPISGVSATANNQSFVAAGLGLSWNVAAGLLLNFDSRFFLWGENTGKGYSFSGGLGYSW